MKKPHAHAQPLGNFFVHYVDRQYQTYLEEEDALYAHIRTTGKSLVAFHKEKLGPQSFCWYGSDCRFWVWKYDKYQVLVNNRKGVCFEVIRDPTVSITEAQCFAVKCWKQYLRSVM